MTTTTAITPQLLAEAMTYAEYRQFIQERLAENQSTGDNHSAAMVGYTDLNEKRMQRLDKTVTLSEATTARLAEAAPQIWLVLTEGWCGDAAQSVPVMAKMAAVNPNIDLRLILRDTNLDVMDEFLTNGGRSIPKLIVLEPQTLEAVASWGPRPAPLQAIFLEAKAKPDFSYPEIQKTIQLWYAKDKNEGIVGEILDVMI